MDIISLLVNQADSLSGRKTPSQGSAATDFAQVMTDIVTSASNAPGITTPPGTGAGSEELSLLNPRGDLTGAMLPLLQSLPELAATLRDNLQRVASDPTARDHDIVPVDERLETKQPETGDVPAATQLATLSSAATALTALQSNSGAGKSSPDGMADILARFTVSPAATTGEKAGLSGGVTTESSQLLAAATHAPETPSAKSAQEDLLVTSAPAGDIDNQRTAVGSRESSLWAAELSAKTRVEVAVDKAGTAAGGAGNPPEAPALSATQQANIGKSASPATQATISQNLSMPGWSQQFSQQILQFAQRGDRQVELRLNPAELGPLSVSLRVDDQGAQAHFLSAHASVRAAVEQAIPQLRETLAEQGISLAEAQVGEQGFGHSHEQQGQASGGHEQSSQPVGRGEPVALDATVPVVDTGLPGAVDTWA